MASSYVPLHLHSNWSLLEGASTIEEYLDAASKMGLHALALTDTNALYGAVPFYKAAKSAHIKPIIGAEIVLRATAGSPVGARRAVPDPPSPPSAVFLAKNSAGYKNLCRLVTARQLDPSFDLVAAAAKYNDGLFVLSSNVEFLRAAAPLVENLYAELPLTLGKKRLRQIFSAARELNLPLVASSDVHFVDPSRHRVHRVLSAIRENALVDNLPPSAFAPSSAYLHTPQEMSAFFKLIPEALENTLRIAAECDFDFTFAKYHFPHTGVPEGETPFSYLSKLAFEGARERYHPLTPAVVNRLAHELDVIEKLNFPEYFLIVADIVRAARSKGIPIAGRGSAADSLVAYCLGITIVDPIRCDLYFERFLNLSRTDCPDIDIDICWKRRDEVIDYVYKKYGQTRVAMISTYITYQARSAFRDVARVFGLPLEEIDDLTKRLPHYGASDIEESVKVIPEAADFPINDEPYKTIVALARQIDSYPRHLGVHLGGLVISDAPLTDYLPLQMATKGIVISQYDMRPVEELGLVKMDLLGQRALSVVFDTAKDVRRLHGVDINFLELPDRDPKVASLVRRGRTIGGFQIESPGMRNLLQMIRARDKNDLLIGLSLIRPGPAASGMKEHYVRRRRGLEKPFYLHESMRRALADTYGVMLYQEDILKVARAVAGFDLAVGDELRKAISKGRSPEAMAAIRGKFIDGARARGVDERAASGVYELVRNFAAYSYCKAHAATYAEISYATMYLKAHYPSSFHAARINNLAGFYHPRVYLEEARRLGVAILLLDINNSSLEFTTGKLGKLGTVPSFQSDICATGPDMSGPASDNSCATAGLAPPCSDNHPLSSREQGWNDNVGAHSASSEPVEGVALASPLPPGEGRVREKYPSLPLSPSTLTPQASTCGTAGLGLRSFSEGGLSGSDNMGRASDRASESPDDQKSPRASTALLFSCSTVSRSAPGEGDSPTAGIYPALRGPTAAAFIRTGFSAVKNLSRRTVDKILSRRAERPFDSFADFLVRVDAAKSECESLVSAGAFSALGRTRPECLLELDAFFNGGAAALATAGSTCLAEYSLLEILALEDSTMEMTPSAHPMTPFVAAARDRGAAPAGRIRDFRGKIATLAGFLVTRRRAPTKNGDYMEFATFEDETDIFEVTLFPDAYRRFGRLFRFAGPFLVKGKVEDQYGALTVTAAFIDYLLPRQAAHPATLSRRAARNDREKPGTVY